MKSSTLRRIFAIIALIFATATIASAQNPIRWRVTTKMTSETEGVLTVHALVTEGWHLYGTTLPTGGPKPTTLDFAASKGIRFIDNFTPSAKPVEKEDAMFGIKLNYWTSNVTFTRKFKLTGKKTDALISGKITYMGCNDETCLPPRTENFTLHLK